MSKIIKVTDEYLEEIVEDFRATIGKVKMADGKVSYTKTFGTIDRKATLKVAEKAWIKMMMLVYSTDMEIAWHGIVYRGEKPDEYLLTDILVYPQSVTGATVKEDETLGPMWSASLDSETFRHMRMQGHSHVSMGVTPSPTDLELYKRYIDQCGDFYVFLILNKKKDKTIKIYDFENNVLFETGDCKVEVVPSEEIGVTSFLKESSEMVKTHVYTPSYYSGGTYYSGNTSAASQGTSTLDLITDGEKSIETQSKTATASTNVTKSNTGKKEKRKGKRKATTRKNDYTKGNIGQDPCSDIPG